MSTKTPAAPAASQELAKKAPRSSGSKKFFRKAKLIVGAPLPVPAGDHEEYEAFSEQLMEHIAELGREGK